MKQFKTNLKRKFTYWYIKKVYTFEYDSDYNAVWNCPWWVKPLLIFFSPSIYILRKCGDIFCESFRKGLQEATESMEFMTNVVNEFAENIGKETYD